MDAIARKSWLLSFAVHAVLVLVSLFGFRLPVPAPRAPASPPPVPAAATGGEIVLAPDAAFPASPHAVLPPLTASLPTSIAPAATSFPGRFTSRGDHSDRSAPVALPQASAATTPLSDALRGQQTNPALSREAANRATAADHLDFLIYHAFPRLWRGYATQLTNRRLIIEVIADERGIIRRATLFHCTTGVPDLDRALADWLVEQGTSLPRLPAGQALRFSVRLP